MADPKLGQLLDEFVDMSSIECLNQDSKHPVANAFEADKNLVLSSDEDVDHQLLIRLSFRQPVKLSAISIRGNSEDESAPQTVKIFQGKVNIGFDEAGDEEPTQLVNLTPANVDTGEAVPLRFVKFQCVHTVQLFVEANFGADATRVSRIQFFGTPCQALDMKDFKPIKG